MATTPRLFVLNAPALAGDPTLAVARLYDPAGALLATLSGAAVAGTASGYTATAAYDDAWAAHGVVRWSYGGVEVAAEAYDAAVTLTAGERDGIAAALLDLAGGVEANLTPRQFARLAAAVLLGKSSGGGAVFRDTGDTKARVTATLDASGNRTAVTRDAT